jgi:hypothetical protein
MGEDVEPVFCGVVKAAPKTEMQKWHVDSLHNTATHGSCNLINGILSAFCLSLHFVYALFDTPVKLLMACTSHSNTEH